ncbi:Bcr/CflA family drug resistance efflux transporter [Paenibacillus tyrfis]|uniref:Bcr/CflA family multidrug efflux MFS transporter n=1 Tax=Paenibacillus tyrfis TaxID=1501230 RepID=UPI00248F6B88|nr:Bcr/CflA family multidrug efflux MFS transporter [Paenibacillus tyrfis]GLI04770.1 Bcr/CflA family drug resistance efflux transporter [Paenibacillus tyrfis]
MSRIEASAQGSVPSRRIWMVFILGSLSAFGPLSLDMYLPALPKLADELSSSTSMAQLSLTACLLGLALGQLYAGPVSDVRGRRVPLLIGLILYGVSSVLCAVAPSAELLVLLRFIQGMAGSAGIVISRAIVRDMYSGTELTKFFSLLMLVNGAAPILAPIVGGQLLEVTSWRGVFVVLGLIGVLMLIAVVLALPETLPQERRSKGGLGNTLTTFRRLLSDRTFMGYALAQGFVIAAMFAYISGSPFVLQDIFGVSPQGFSVCFAINGLGIILAGQVTGRLAGRVSDKRLLVSGLGLASVAGVALLLAIVSGAGLYAILVPLFFVVSSVGIVSTAGFSLAMRNQSEAAGSASALLGVLSFIFGGIVAPLVGIAGNQTAVPMGIVIAAADVSSVLCYLLLVRRHENKA